MIGYALMQAIRDIVDAADHAFDEKRALNDLRAAEVSIKMAKKEFQKRLAKKRRRGIKDNGNN